MMFILLSLASFSGKVILFVLSRVAKISTSLLSTLFTVYLGGSYSGSNICMVGSGGGAFFILIAYFILLSFSIGNILGG